MNSLSPEEKKIILDFYFRCGPDEDINRARDLIASDSRAAELYSKLEAGLKQLDAIKYEPCPDNLTDLTIAKLKLASASQRRLENLLAREQAKDHPVTTRHSYWRLLELATIAAVMVLVVTIWQPACSQMRQVAWQKKCQANLGKIGAGIINYGNDHNTSLPYAAKTAGTPWWEIGEHGEDNHSNTRHLWLLVKNNYIEPENCICQARSDARPADYYTAELQRYPDFPNRHALSYSFMFMCENSANRKLTDKTILMADLNPVFEDIFDSSGRPKLTGATTLWLNEQLKMMLSTNHGQRGQNILLGDGSVKFAKSRVLFNDDIYTVRGRDVYSGYESPCDEKDVFLVP